MVTQNLSPALRAPASSTPYPKAKPGYGKRGAPNQLPLTGQEFALLPERERYVAGFVEHLPDGSAMDVKTLAKQLPLYGQQAIGSALTALSVAGHLRRVRRPVGDGDQVRWVFHTYWSRTARDNEWWCAFLATEGPRTTAEPVPSTVPDEPGEPPAPTEALSPPRSADDASGPSPAYRALAQLGRREPRLALSAVDCALLEGLAQGWFDRGVDAEYLIQALSSGLPVGVDSPVGFVRARLTRKLPPQLPADLPDGDGTDRRLMVECTECGAPGPAEVFRDGLCGPCRRSVGSPEAP